MVERNLPIRDAELEAKAASLITSTLVWDNHACLPLRPHASDFFDRLIDLHRDGLDVVSVNVGFGPSPLHDHLAMIEGLTTWIEANASDCRLVRTTNDIDAARTANQLAVFFDVEGMAPLAGGRIDLIETFRRSGVGWMLVAYNKANEVGSGCVEPDDGGLTGYGREVIDEMKRVGMMICCSHTGHRTAREVIEYAGVPVIFSHSNAASVHAHYRNISDELIRACAQSGGVVGINGMAVFLGDGPATIASLVDHIEHVAEIAGIDHVGLGLDHVFDEQELVDYLATNPELFPGMNDLELASSMIGPGNIHGIAQELLRRGFAAEEVRLILGANWMRVAQEIWT